jgi:hypothetical protein
MTQALFHPTGMTAPDYARHFPDIGVQLNWRRFEAEGWPVERRVLTDRDELLGFHTFFRRSLGRVMPHFLHWVASRQMRIGEVLDHLGRIPQEHRATIDYFVEQWLDDAGPIEMDLPIYRFRGDGHFIVDGNHRACAIALSGRPFRIELFSIAGPLDRDALVDIVHCR